MSNLEYTEFYGLNAPLMQNLGIAWAWKMLYSIEGKVRQEAKSRSNNIMCVYGAVDHPTQIYFPDLQAKHAQKQAPTYQAAECFSKEIDNS